MESALGEGAKSLVSQFAGSWAQEVVHDTVKALGDNLAGLLLQALLKKTDVTAALLEKQVRSPFTTGSRLATEAIGLLGTSAEQRHFRDKLIEDALSQLERAYSFAEGTPNATAQQFQIRLLQALPPLAIRGPASMQSLDYGSARLSSRIVSKQRISGFANSLS